MDDQVVDVRPTNGSPHSTMDAAFSTPFNVVKLYATVCFSDPEYPEYHSFCFKSRNNVTNKERRELRAKNRDLLAYNEWWFKAKAGDKHKEYGVYNEDDTPQMREWAMFAPYVVDWNAHVADEKGNLVKIDPPAVAGPSAFDEIDPPVSSWIINLLNIALLGGKGLIFSEKKSRDMLAPSSGGSTESPN